MANVQITQLPNASAITGTELVPIVQNGVTVKTTTASLAGSPVLTASFLEVSNSGTTPNSRYFAVDSGLTTTDGGAGGAFTIGLTGAVPAFNALGNGVVVKTGVSTLANRTITAGTVGLSLTNGDGVSGNPTVNLTGLALNVAQLAGSGILAISGGASINPRTITGTSDQIVVANGTGASGDPTLSFANNPIFPGVASITVPRGTTAQRPTATPGMIRYNTDNLEFEFFEDNSWVSYGQGQGTVTSVTGTAEQITVINGTTTPVISITSDPTLPGTGAVIVPAGSTVQRNSSEIAQFRYNTDLNQFEGCTNSGWSQFTLSTSVSSFRTTLSGLTPSTATTGAIVLAGTLGVASGGTGAVTLTGYVKGNGISAFTASSTIPTTDLSGTISNAQLANSSVTYNGVTVALGASGTISAANPYALTISTGLTGTSYDGSAAVTIAIDSTVVTLTDTQTLTNKTISGADNTLTNIPNVSLDNSSITINGTLISLGGSDTITASTTSALTIGTGLTGTSFDGSTPVTITIDSTVATLTDTQTLTNKSMDGNDNTFTNLPNSALTNSSVTIGTDSLSLGGTLTTLHGVSISGSDNTLTNIPNSAFTNDSITVGTTTIALGGSSTSVVGLTDVSIGTSTSNPSNLFTLTNAGYFSPLITNTAGGGLDIYIANDTHENYIGVGAGTQGAGELYIWTDGAAPLGFYTNHTLRQAIDENGVIKFFGDNVTSITPFTTALAVMEVDVNDYKEFYGRNLNSGSDASFDFVIYNDVSDVDSYFIDMGMNSSGFSSATYPIFTANSGYLYTGGGSSGQSSNLFLGTSNANSDLIFFTGDVETANIRSTIKGNTGNFLIGTSADTGELLQVNGSMYVDGATEFGSTVLLSADPTLALQAATKQYVDDKVSTGINYHEAVQVATTQSLAAQTGGTVTYNAPGPEGVGATITLSVALTVLDGYTLLNTNRILVKDEVNQAYNGIYTWATGGTVLTRATDADTYGPNPNQLSQNDYFYVQNGTTNKGSAWIVATVGTINFTTTPIVFNQFSSAQIYTATAPLNISGTVISLTGTVSATNGGTGTNTVTTGDLLYGSATNTWSKLALGSAYKSLIVNGSGTQVEWNSVPLNQTTAVSGQLGTTNGGTGLSSYTTGDIIYSSATNTLSKLGVGTNGYILTVSSGLPSWQPAPASGVTSFQTSLSGLTPSTSTTGAITLAGTLGVSSGGTGASTLTGYVKGSGTSPFTAAATIPFADISGTVSTTNAATFNNSGSGAASGATFDGSSAKTISYNTLGAPKADGTGASGTWAINISGNAATATSATSATSATTATNLAGGSASTIPYQSAVGTTAFIANGTAGQVLTSAGSGTPVWSGISGGTF